MKLKEILVEVESSEIAERNRDISGDIFMDQIAADNNGLEIEIQFKDGYGTAVIYFDEHQNTYVKDENIEIEENENSVEIDLEKLKGMIVKAVDDKIKDLFGGDTKIPKEIDLKTYLPIK